jgi:putative hydrolase of the HAD superfamily
MDAPPQRGTLARTTAVFFDVDFTLIYPGPTFQGEGYARFCRKHGVTVDPLRFEAAVAAASTILDDDQQVTYEHELFVRYTRAIIEAMGGQGPTLDACAREIYDEWAACQHFFLYEDVRPTLQQLAASGYKLGLISNSHRCLASFQEHFDLGGLIAGAVSSSEHGFLKPHPSIFEVALKQIGVEARQALMVGDSFRHDIQGALRVGMRGVLVRRAGGHLDLGAEVPVICSLTDLPLHL